MINNSFRTVHDMCYGLDYHSREFWSFNPRIHVALGKTPTATILYELLDHLLTVMV